MRFRSDIEGLRAVAVLLVLLFHFAVPFIGPGGFMGVDIFFVISGFLITGIIKHKLDKADFGLGDFYRRRIRRLAPSLVATMLLVLAYGSWALFPNELDELARQVAASQLYVANIYYWRSVNYFGLNSEGVALLHTWSLAVEEQFYLLFPVTMMMVHRYARRYFWHAIAGACAASFALNLAVVSIKPEATFYLLPTRAWELLLGALAHPLARRWQPRQMHSQALSLLGVGLIAAAVSADRTGYSFPGAFALLPTLGALFVIVSGTSSVTWVSRALSWAWVTYIGRISYALYLVHWPINVFAKDYFDDYGLAPRLAMLLLSIVLAMLIQHLVEDPVRAWSGRITGRRVAWAYLSSLAGVLAVAVLVLGTNGLPGRYPPAALAAAAYVNDRLDGKLGCEWDEKGDMSAQHLCTIGSVDKEPRWLVYGDSHAWAASAAFDAWLRQKGEAGLLVFRHACLPVSGLEMAGNGLCRRFNLQILKLLDSQPRLTNVVVISTWLQVLEVKLSDAAGRRLDTSEAKAAFAPALRTTLEQLRGPGRRVLVWEPVPGARKSVPLALAHEHTSGRSADIEWTRSEYRSRFKFFFDALAQVGDVVTGVFATSRVLCASGKCAVAQGGVPLYFDQAHISASTANAWLHIIDASLVPPPAPNLPSAAERP